MNVTAIGGKKGSLTHNSDGANQSSAGYNTEYGSATFIEANKIAVFEVRVSTTGLLIRKVE